MTPDASNLRDALGCFATGVAVVTGVGPDGSPVGVTVNSFSSVSLEPPLVLFSLDRRAYAFAAFDAARHFAVNVLRRDHASISDTFADPGGPNWDGVAFTTWESGCPILSGALAAFDCEIRERHDGGDHVIIVGEVLRFGAEPAGDPLVFFRGRYRRIAAED